MSQVRLPDPLSAFVEAVNRGDSEAFLAFFAADGAVDDWGRRFEGHKGIRRWSDGEFIGAKGTFTPVAVREEGGVVTVTADWASEVFTGRSDFVFSFEDGLIKEMRIPAH